MSNKDKSNDQQRWREQLEQQNYEQRTELNRLRNQAKKRADHTNSSSRPGPTQRGIS